MQHLMHNQIADLEGLACLRGRESGLKTLDLRGNALTALSLLAPLAGCRVQHLLLSGSGTAAGGHFCDQYIPNIPSILQTTELSNSGRCLSEPMKHRTQWDDLIWPI